jgi:hypothetical protein
MNVGTAHKFQFAFDEYTGAKDQDRFGRSLAAVELPMGKPMSTRPELFVDEGPVVGGTAKGQVIEEQISEPLVPIIPYRSQESIYASVIQMWEGKVISVDAENEVMQVLLNAKIGVVSAHTGEIELQWVSDQDRDLVRPGAIFYLTLSRRLKRSGIENAQEIRFRRLPSWTKKQIAEIEAEADKLWTKLKAAKDAE